MSTHGKRITSDVVSK